MVCKRTLGREGREDEKMREEKREERKKRRGHWTEIMCFLPALNYALLRLPLCLLRSSSLYHQSISQSLSSPHSAATANATIISPILYNQGPARDKTPRSHGGSGHGRLQAPFEPEIPLAGRMGCPSVLVRRHLAGELPFDLPVTRQVGMIPD